ncbi:MAG: galactokinase [Blastocatellia bacterium]|nr:galactokinase [Blastocatellia bacterium]
MQQLLQTFQDLYGTSARLYHAPGRVNLIGEHTDYNDGFVMPAAIGFFTWVAAAPRADRRLVIHSANFEEQVEFDLDVIATPARQHWTDYVYGVAVTLEHHGYRLRGANMLIRGEVPIGAGLSSSAAIEVATGYALLDTAGYTIDPIELATLCQRAESDYVGLRCGIMDQFISCCGRRGHAVLLDCRSLGYRLLPLPEEARLVICNTMVKHSLASGEYNQRRTECEAGVQHLRQFLPEVQALRDVSLAELKRYGRDLPEVIYRRCHHVISENERVLVSANALDQDDFITFGQLMNESHRSLRDDYEVSCAELDLLVQLASEIEGVYGARMTGGGFGGCTINLVKAENVRAFEQVVAQEYQRRTGYTPEIYVCSAADGAERV